jgi:hypothetical protein
VHALGLKVSIFSPNNVCCIFFSATKFITTHCQFDGINHWPGVINGDEVSKSRISPFIAETISLHPKLDVHLVHTRMSSNSSGQNKNKIKGMTINVNPVINLGICFKNRQNGPDRRIHVPNCGL